MNKELVSLFATIIALFLGALYYNNLIQAPFISTLNSIKSTYRDGLEYIHETVYTHTFQAEHIEELEDKLQKYENNHLVMQQLASEINDMYEMNHSEMKSDPRVELVRVISYAKFANFNKVWIEVPDYNASKIYGLVYKELVAGIVVPKNGKALALLNQDIKSSYAVFIGDQHAPGIAHGNNSKNIIIKFIPSWFEIHEGDEVSTSGLDNIFFKGLKVGKVLSITKSQGYQNALVEPYYNANDPNYFYMIKSVQ